MLNRKENLFKKIYIESKIHRLIKKFWEEMLSSFRYSLFARFTEIKNQDKITIFENSKFVREMQGLYRKLTRKIIGYLKMSIVASSIVGLKEDLRSLSVKMVSIVLISAILTNIFFFIFLTILGAAFFRDSPFFHQKIGLLGWVVRGMFLFIGLVGLFFDVAWEELKKTSFVLYLIHHR